MRSVARGGSGRRDRGAAGVGQKALSQVLLAVPRREGRRRRLRRPASRPRPRNFTTGKFKVRTTPNGALPTHQDLVNIIRRGMPYTSMPAWPNFSDQEVTNVAYYLTTFSPDFSNAESAPARPLPSAPSATKESIELGKKLYVETGCVKCHGTLGRGDGTSAPTLKDDWDHPIPPADLAQSWTFRGGSSREDIFSTMSTGLNGTPMPSFVDALTPEQRWAITDFIVSLSGSNGPAIRTSSSPSTSRIHRSCQGGRELRLRACGPPSDRRADHGARTLVPSARDERQRSGDLRADSIALLVRWHDMSAEKTGRTGLRFPCLRRRKRSRRRRGQ